MGEKRGWGWAGRGFGGVGGSWGGRVGSHWQRKRKVGVMEVTAGEQQSKMAADGRGHGGEPTNPRWLPAEVEKWPPMEEVTGGNQPTQDGCRWRGLQWPISSPRWPPMEEVMVTDPPKMAADGGGYNGRPTAQDGCQWKSSWWAISTPRWPLMEEVMVTDPPKMAANGRHYNGQPALQDGHR